MYLFALLAQLVRERSACVGGSLGCQTSKARWVCPPDSRDAAAAALKRLLVVSPWNSLKYRQGRNAGTGAWTTAIFVHFKINCIIIGGFLRFSLAVAMELVKPQLGRATGTGPHLMPNLLTRTAMIFPSPWAWRFLPVIQLALPKAVPSSRTWGRE